MGWRSISDIADDEAYEHQAEIERLRSWIKRINNINDNPARFNKDIDEACEAAMAGKPMVGTIDANWPAPVTANDRNN